MKYLTCSIIMVALLLSGCRGQTTVLHSGEKQAEQEIVAQNEASSGVVGRDAAEKENIIAIEDTVEHGQFAKYDEYTKELCFVDCCLSAKCWLVGDGNIVEMIYAGDVSYTTVVDKVSIVRVEHLNAGVFTTISVFDKTGQSITLMVSSEDAEKLLGLLEAE
ncbi:MAG: hypothetical protein E7400_03860 [Ruminococcaceae bacterium]|nr:hypothetical protein [Oscillospiraceae bacterium]